MIHHATHWQFARLPANHARLRHSQHYAFMIASRFRLPGCTIFAPWFDRQGFFPIGHPSTSVQRLSVAARPIGFLPSGALDYDSAMRHCTALHSCRSLLTPMPHGTFSLAPPSEVFPACSRIGYSAPASVRMLALDRASLRFPAACVNQASCLPVIERAKIELLMYACSNLRVYIPPHYMLSRRFRVSPKGAGSMLSRRLLMNSASATIDAYTIGAAVFDGFSCCGHRGVGP